MKNCVYYGTEATYGLMKAPSKDYLIEHSFWLYEPANNIGCLHSSNNYEDDITNFSFVRNTNLNCLIAPEYSRDLVEELNDWVFIHDGNIKYNKWEYEIVNGYARPRLIPE